MKKWFNEEYSFEIEVIGFLRGDKTENYCRNGEETGDIYIYLYIRLPRKQRRLRDLL